MFRNRNWLACLGVLVFLFAELAPAAPPPVPVSQLTVDVVTLKRGASLRGTVLEQRPNGDCLMVVSEQWLKQHAATRHAAAVEKNAEIRLQAWQRLQDRIQQRLQEPELSPRMKFLFEQEQARVAKLQKQSPPPAEFLQIELPKQEIVRIAQPSPERRRIGIFAWYADLPDVEQRSVASLQKELKTLDFPLDGPLPDLSVKLSPREQTDREWATRLTLIDFALSEDPLEFQGTGETFVRVGNGRTVDWQAILPGLLEQQTQQLFQELLGPTPRKAGAGSAGLKRATDQATALKRRAFRLTRVDATSDSAKVSIDSRLMIQTGAGDWQVLWSTTQTADSTVARPELEERITADPQVQAIFRSLQSLSLAGDDLLRTAIRHGAATMDAQSAADAEFFRFRDRYLTHLDAPPLSAPQE